MKKVIPAICFTAIFIFCSILLHANSKSKQPDEGLTPPDFNQLHESFVKYINKIAVKRKTLNYKQLAETDALPDEAETQNKLAGVTKAHYESTMNAMFGYDIVYRATIQEKSKEKSAAEKTYNSWKSLLGQCLTGTRITEDVSNPDFIIYKFESGKYQEYGDARFSVVLRLYKEKGTYTVDLMIGE